MSKQTDLITLTDGITTDSSGNVLVGTTNGNPTGNHEPGTLITASGQINVHRDGGNPLRVGSSVDGNLTEYYKQGALVGRIGSNTGRPYIYGGSGLKLGLNAVQPCNSDGSNSDNDQDLGSSSVRFDDIFATNGTIQTSYANE